MEIKTTTSFAEILLVVFIVLKLTNVIDWSWWWVLSPFWIQTIIVILLYIYVKVHNHRVDQRIRERMRRD